MAASTNGRRFQALLDDLQGAWPPPWSRVTEWAAKAKPVFRRYLPDFVSDFEELVKEPRRRGGGVRSGSDLDKPMQDIRRAVANTRRELGLADLDAEYEDTQSAQYEALLRFMESVISVADVPPPAKDAHTHFHGPVHHGDRHEVSITGSNVGAVASGAGSTAKGNVTVSPSDKVSQVEFKDSMAELQRAMVTIQDKLDESDDRVYEFCTDILRRIRKMELDQEEVRTVLARVDDAFDDEWSKAEAKGLRPDLGKIRDAFKIAQDVVTHPLTAEIVKTLAGG